MDDEFQICWLIEFHSISNVTSVSVFNKFESVWNYPDEGNQQLNKVSGAIVYHQCQM